ncbi:unnamed protein product [Protopolystoma xenopodis]|uniref:Uncharacterized protein n=1 Tax=Protopolystoma xenopodis TaxID=117903 RepID=A0A448XB69_9PLAT|nr:unnamed protein product [Protopolystoma xenopodis]
MKSSFECRAGYASSKVPHLCFRNLVHKHRLKKGDISVGNDITSLDDVRYSLKSPFDRNLSIHIDVQEHIFDYIFTKLGITTSTIENPIVLNETICNPNTCRMRTY